MAELATTKTRAVGWAVVSKLNYWRNPSRSPSMTSLL